MTFRILYEIITSSTSC